MFERKTTKQQPLEEEEEVVVLPSDDRVGGKHSVDYGRRRIRTIMRMYRYGN